MGLEGLLTELLVATVLDSVELHAVRVGVHEVILGEEVGDEVESGRKRQHHHDDDLVIGHLLLAEVGDVLCDIVGHLGGG